MFDTIEIMRIAQSMAKHASARQTLVAENIANADTPGYRARDLPSFTESYRAQANPTELRATRDGHVAGLDQGPGGFRAIVAGAEPSPNGNTVSLESEMVKSADVRHQHDMALAVYKTSLDIMRSALGRR